ncbi:hypothetical protein DFH09DRAFT_1084646 [Mycena vulgaris]|nr:hypothetical protein DFH09DRAFT_1084646 [Mycena vulgaris]
MRALMPVLFVLFILLLAPELANCPSVPLDMVSQLYSPNSRTTYIYVLFALTARLSICPGPSRTKIPPQHMSTLSAAPMSSSLHAGLDLGSLWNPAGCSSEEIQWHPIGFLRSSNPSEFDDSWDSRVVVSHPKAGKARWCYGTTGRAKMGVAVKEVVEELRPCGVWWEGKMLRTWYGRKQDT